MDDKERELWLALRDAVAVEFIEKLPYRMTMNEVAQLLRCPTEDVHSMVASGDIVPEIGSDGRYMIPALNSSLLRRELILCMPLPH